MPICQHLERVENDPKPAGGCPQCVEMGDIWVHLRFCVTCSAVGCCEDSKNQHALKHARAHDHPVVRSKEPGEMWAWCYADTTGFTIREPEIWA